MPRHFSLTFHFISLPAFYLTPKSSSSPAKQSTRRRTTTTRRSQLVMAESKNPSSDHLLPQKNNPQPKTLTNILYKSILFAIIIALLPLFPPQTPESNNPTLLSRTWELLHLLLVGIAISYGIFSRRNTDHDIDKDKEKDAAFKLQIPPVFDEEDSKTETWRNLSQYNPPDPVVVESKPLLLPVRSLKKSRSQISDSAGPSSSALSSPIPWKSRSGRIELRDASPSSSFYAKDCSFSSNEDPEKSFRAVGVPPPPPPPPAFSRGFLVSRRREVRKSFKDELKDLSLKGREGFVRSSSLDYYSPPNVAQSMNRDEGKHQAETKKKEKKKKKVEFMEKMIVMSDDSESEKASDSSDAEKVMNLSREIRVEPQENEVDKKADEFIAKFREQIRLQRIESIKKSSGHRAVKNAK